MSSSAIPLIDAELAWATSTAAIIDTPSLFSRRDAAEALHYSVGVEKETVYSYAPTTSNSPEMEPPNSGGNPQEPRQATPSSGSLSNDQKLSDRSSESRERRGREGKSRWFSQLKEWVTISEPSTQALKNYKKDTYKKADIALDDPLANVKLHLPVASLPPDAIKPSGSGPEPEDIVLKRAMYRKQAHEATPVSRACRGPPSGSSHGSSSNSATASARENN